MTYRATYTLPALPPGRPDPRVGGWQAAHEWCQRYNAAVDTRRAMQAHARQEYEAAKRALDAREVG